MIVWAYLDKSLCEHMLFILGMYLEKEWLGHMLNLCFTI